MSEFVTGKPLGPRVVSLPDYCLRPIFSNGEERMFDASALLKDEAFFRFVRADDGTICWPGNIDERKRS